MLTAMRPILRPGTHVLRRGSGELQVGLDPRAALVLPDCDPVRESLHLLARSGDLADHPDSSTYDALDAHDVVVDERSVLPLLAGQGLAPHATAALARTAGDRAPELCRARRESRTAVRSFGHTCGGVLRRDLLSLMDAAALPEHGGRSTPDVGVLLGVGEPDRELLDEWTRAATPYLLVRLTEGRAVVGPFVVPGRTACLRCIDAHHTDADPAWPLLVRQYAEAASRDRPDGAPEPVDPLLAALAVSWAARDLAAYVDGQRPSTWSTTLTLHPRPDALESRIWLRHAACSCSWD
jgi:bacteriocin biosynthesis cyclodehydratase domain-containing protein